MGRQKQSEDEGAFLKAEAKIRNAAEFQGVKDQNKARQVSSGGHHGAHCASQRGRLTTNPVKKPGFQELRGGGPESPVKQGEASLPGVLHAV